MIKTILFDMDGTLLPMDQNAFAKAYFSTLSKRIAPHGYEPKRLIDGVLAGTEAMIRNDGEKTNEARFWEKFACLFGDKVYGEIPLFDEYYRTDFEQIRAVCGHNPAVAQAIQTLKNDGYTLVLASNPIFPRIAQVARMHWSGVDQNDFALVTSYENMHFCKPNPAYYTEIADMLKVDPAECLMVGNDVREDMKAASAIGMQVFLIEGCVLNTDNADISKYPKGSFVDLLAYVEKQ